MKFNRTWDIVRRCPNCEGEARKSSWVEYSSFCEKKQWSEIKSFKVGWICEDCGQKIYGINN